MRTNPKDRRSEGWRSRSRRWWLAAGLLALGLAVYANGLTGPFIFDDQESIVANPHVLHLRPLISALTAPLDSPVARRPLVSLTFALNYALGAFSPRGYHVTNLVIHLLNGLLVFGILSRVFDRRALEIPLGERTSLVAFVCALVWLIHPLQTEMVDYVTQRSESLMALFYLLTFYCSVRAMEGDRRSRSWSIAGVAACLAGMACKESMATAPVMVLLYDVVFESGTLRTAWHRRARFYLGLASTWLLLVVLVTAGPSIHSRGFVSDVSPWTYLLNQAPMVARYIRLALWPTTLVLDYGAPRSLPWSNVVLPGLLIAILLAATAIAWARNRPLAFLGTWFFVTLAPASSILPVATEAGAERRMYLPLLAVIVFVVVGVVRGTRRFLASSSDRVQLTAVIVACLVLGTLTARRNDEYRDPVTLWRTSVERYPHARAHFGLGTELRKKGLRDEAISEFETAAADYPKARYALGLMAAEDGRNADAIANLREYIRLRPYEEEVVVAHSVLGRALTVEGRFDEAAAAFERVLVMQPSNTEARIGLAEMFTKHGVALAAEGREGDAAIEFQKAVSFAPNDSAILENLGVALAATARANEAIATFTRALALAPRRASLYAQLGTVLLDLNKTEEAFTQFEQALEMAPADDRVRGIVATALRRFGGRMPPRKSWP